MAIELDKLVDQTGFPRIRRDEHVAKLRLGEFLFASYTIQVARQKDAGIIFEIALDRATDENDPAFCAHGNRRHSVFFESIEQVRSAIERREHSVIIESRINQITGEQVDRLLIESPFFNRKTFVPGIMLQSEYWQARGQAAVDAQLKKIAKESVGAAILFAFYAGKSIDEVFDLFVNLQLQQKTPTRSRAGDERARSREGDNRARRIASDRRVLGEVRNLITVTRHGDVEPVTDSDSYNQAVVLLSNAGFILDGELDGDRFQFKEKIYQVKARCVFEGMSTVALEVAHEAQLSIEPINRYILEKYGRIFTTKLLTAYLVFGDE